MVQYMRGWMGLLMLAVGIAMTFLEQTKDVSWLLIGFGIGMMTSGFQ